MVRIILHYTIQKYELGVFFEKKYILDVPST